MTRACVQITIRCDKRRDLPGEKIPLKSLQKSWFRNWSSALPTLPFVGAIWTTVR